MEFKTISIPININQFPPPPVSTSITSSAPITKNQWVMNTTETTINDGMKLCREEMERLTREIMATPEPLTYIFPSYDSNSRVITTWPTPGTTAVTGTTGIDSVRMSVDPTLYYDGYSYIPMEALASSYKKWKAEQEKYEIKEKYLKENWDETSQGFTKKAHIYVEQNSTLDYLHLRLEWKDLIRNAAIPISDLECAKNPTDLVQATFRNLVNQAGLNIGQIPHFNPVMEKVKKILDSKKSAVAGPPADEPSPQLELF